VLPLRIGLALGAISLAGLAALHANQVTDTGYTLAFALGASGLPAALAPTLVLVRRPTLAPAPA
jgi:hypothetical protein